MLACQEHYCYPMGILSLGRRALGDLLLLWQQNDQATCFRGRNHLTNTFAEFCLLLPMFVIGCQSYCFGCASFEARCSIWFWKRVLPPKGPEGPSHWMFCDDFLRFLQDDYAGYQAAQKKSLNRVVRFLRLSMQHTQHAGPCSDGVR